MVEEGVGIPGVEELEKLEGGGKGGRSRLALAVVLLLLLLLCGITTVTDVWTTAPSSAQRQAILRNIECLRCHVEMLPLYTKATVHNPFLKKQCTTCHTPHGEIIRTTTTFGPVERWQRLRTMLEWLPLQVAWQIGGSPASLVGTSTAGPAKTSEKRVKGADSKLQMDETELCWVCHGNIGHLRSMAYTHNPFMKGRCTSCHNPHASDNMALLKQDEHDLCITCHPIGRELNRAQQHPPVAQHSCLVCHNPHASEYRGILVDSQRNLCFVCHPTVAPLSLKPVQHQPFAGDNCTGCHEPHGSDYLPLLRAAQPELCYKCHGAIRYDFTKASHHPVGTVNLTCADCHDPHAADYRFLLTAKGNDFCFKCHAQAQGTTHAILHTLWDPSAHSANGVLCIRCHTPHGSRWAPLLRNSNPDLCLECHAPTVEGPNKHPFQSSLWDVAAKAPLTCTSTCHNPHGTDQNYMLKRYSYPYDGQCLQCHGVTPGKRVGIDF